MAAAKEENDAAAGVTATSSSRQKMQPSGPSKRVSFELDNDERPPSAPPALTYSDSADNGVADVNNNQHGDHSSYKEFLGLLSSSSPSRAPTPPTMPSTSDEEESDGNVPPPPAAAPSSSDQQDDAGQVVDDGHDCEFISVNMAPLSDPIGRSDEEKEDVLATSTSSFVSIVSNSSLVSIDEEKSESSVEIPLKNTSSGDEDNSSPLFSSETPRSTSSSNLTKQMIGMSNSSGTLPQSAHLHPEDSDRKTNDKILPASGSTKSLRPILRQSFRRRAIDNHLSQSLTQSWHPTSILKGLETELSEHNTEHSSDLERKEPKKKSLRVLIREPSRRKTLDSLSLSWHSKSLLRGLDKDKDSSDQPKHSQKKKIKERPKLERQQTSRSMRLRRLSNHSLDPAEMDQVDIVDDHKVHPSRKRFHWWHAIFIFSLVSLLVCLLQLFLPPPFGLMMTSAEVAEVGVAPGCDDDLERCICPRETICATDKLSIILLALARSSACFDYPLYMMMFLSKAHNINNHLRRTFVREWIDFGDMHTVHKIFGIVVGIETMSHSFFHLFRWGLDNELNLLWQSTAGMTGFTAAFVTPLICWPMVFPILKRRMSFEVRKGLHYLFIVWAFALLFHAPSRIPWLIGIPALIYAIDFVFGYFMTNNLIETAYFERYGENGVAVHFKNPPSWENRAPTSYVYIMCPWISKYQWHAFTTFPEPLKENHSMLCIGASGDWTKELHDKIQAPCLRQVYVHGPLMTEFSDKAITTANAIAVATGVGITPTLSLMMRYAGRKRINIIWVCRDPGLIEYILHKVDISGITKNSYAFIFYTGRRELALPKRLPVNLFIFNTRPNLENVISGIITTIHSGEGLPEEMYEKQKKIAKTPFRKRLMIAMYRVTQVYDESEMFDFALKETEKQAEKMQEKDIDLESSFSLDSDSDSEADGSTKLSLRRSSGRSVSITPADQVSLLGFDAMIAKFLGVIGEYSDSDVKSMFQMVDKNGTGFIDREDFSDFIRLAQKQKKNAAKRESTKELLASMKAVTDMETALSNSIHNSTALLPQAARTSSIHGSTSHGSVFGDANTIEYVQKLMNNSSHGENPLEDWSLFYCGGSNGIKKNLKEISMSYNIDLAIEKFNW